MFNNEVPNSLIVILLAVLLCIVALMMSGKSMLDTVVLSLLLFFAGGAYYEATQAHKHSHELGELLKLVAENQALKDIIGEHYHEKDR